VSGGNGERAAWPRIGRSWWTRWLGASSGPVGRSRGPRVVAIGGGTGLSVLLRGLKELTNNITAVVTVADDGGSSGRLRSELGVPPMGDIRACIVALADNETQMGRLLQYRFPEPAEDDRGGTERPRTNGVREVAGHSFGNLLIAALTDLTGDFEEAVRQANRVLAVRGRVVPVAGRPITLHARLGDGSELLGESSIERSVGIDRVWITPADITPSREAIDALRAAELIVIGPGSVYTSLLPPLLIPAVRDAVAAAGAPRIYVCNVATQVGETQGYALSDHLAAFARHGLDGLIDAVLANDNYAARTPGKNYPAAPVRLDISNLRQSRPLIVPRDVVDHGNAHRHDAHHLAAALMELYDDRVLRARAHAAVSP
jgi:uncharacterized cofD-like protein